MGMKKGSRVYVRFMDITADLHTEKDLEPALCEACGWILSDTKKALKLTTCRYPEDKCNLKDRITIPKGCVESVEVI